MRWMTRRATSGRPSRKVLAADGPAGLMRGWTANYVRLGPQTVITFIALEKLRGLAGLDSL